MDGNDVTEKLDTDIHKLKVGDRLWVKVNENGIAENPFRRDHECIHVPDANPGENVFIEITSKPGGIKSRVIHREDDDKEDDPDIQLGSERDEKIVWRGTDQDPSREEAKKRREVRKEGDIRASKNDLLDGHL